MKRTNKKGITMVELVVAMAITAIIGTGAMILHRNSVKITSAGIANVEMMREADLILDQIRDDLKHACLPYRDEFSISFDDIVQLEMSKSTGLEGAEFSFHRFKGRPEFANLGYYNKDYMIKPITKITYRLEKIEGSDLLRLVREVREHKDKPKSKALTERVGFFNIKPISIKTETTQKELWAVDLQLSQRTDTSSEVLRGENCLKFYDVVYSDFYKSIAENPKASRNWNTGLTFSIK
jgi:hypothetical protein